jgi:hypothetical protein
MEYLSIDSSFSGAILAETIEGMLANAAAPTADLVKKLRRDKFMFYFLVNG